jgi:hypothetical protein
MDGSEREREGGRIDGSERERRRIDGSERGRGEDGW